MADTPTLSSVATALAKVMEDIRLLPEEAFPRGSRAERWMHGAEDSVIDALDAVNAAIATEEGKR